MLSKLLGKGPKTTQQPPVVTLQGKTASGQTVVIVEDPTAFRNLHDKLAQNENKRQQLDQEIATAKREQFEAENRVAQHQTDIDSNQLKLAQIQKEKQQAQTQRQQAQTERQQNQQQLEAAEAEKQRLMAQLAQIRTAKQQQALATTKV